MLLQLTVSILYVLAQERRKIKEYASSSYRIHFVCPNSLCICLPARISQMFATLVKQISPRWLLDNCVKEFRYRNLLPENVSSNFQITYASLPAAARIPVESSYSIHRTALEQRPTVATQVSVRTSHIFRVPSWAAVRTRSPDSIRTQLTYKI